MRYLITLLLVGLFLAGVSVGWWLKGRGIATAIDTDGVVLQIDASSVTKPGVADPNAPMGVAAIKGLPRDARHSAYEAYLAR
ncbi:MAG: hypothetical protein ACI8VR_003181, partial [Candidatus Azotimanducaceae bacterium]